MKNDNPPCGTVTALDAYLAKQEKDEAEAVEISKIADEILIEESCCILGKHTQKALGLCEVEWYEFMDMADIVIDSASVKEVVMLARLAQAFKNKLTEALYDEMLEQAKSEYLHRER